MSEVGGVGTLHFSSTCANVVTCSKTLPFFSVEFEPQLPSCILFLFGNVYNTHVHVRVRFIPLAPRVIDYKIYTFKNNDCRGKSRSLLVCQAASVM